MAKKQVRVSLRKPQPSEVDAFVSGETRESVIAGQGASRESAIAARDTAHESVMVPRDTPRESVGVPREAARPVSAEGEVLAHNGRELRELVVLLPIELSRKLSLYCLDRQCDVNRVVADAIEAQLGAPKEAKVEAAPSALHRYAELVRSLWATLGAAGKVVPDVRAWRFRSANVGS